MIAEHHVTHEVLDDVAAGVRVRPITHHISQADEGVDVLVFVALHDGVQALKVTVNIRKDTNAHCRSVHVLTKLMICFSYLEAS